jgi:spore maturation protein CgeB
LPDREARVEEFLIRTAEQLPDRKFLLGGIGWDSKLLPSNVKNVGHVYTPDHNSFNCTPRAVLNISRASMARFGFSPATRVFEAAGAAACLITDGWEGIEQFFEPEKEVLVAQRGDEVAARLEDLTPGRAHEIGRAAYHRALSEHTYAHRAMQFDQILGDRSRRARSQILASTAARSNQADASPNRCAEEKANGAELTTIAL